MCLAEKFPQEGEDSGGFEQDAFSDLEELDFQVSEDAASSVVAALHCLGRERGAFLGHASSSLRLQFAIMCIGHESGLCLAHYDGEVYLTPNACDLCPLRWYVQKQWDGYTISCYSKWSWQYLSHAHASLFLQKGFKGAGDLWQCWIK